MGVAKGLGSRVGLRPCRPAVVMEREVQWSQDPGWPGSQLPRQRCNPPSSGGQDGPGGRGRDACRPALGSTMGPLSYIRSFLGAPLPPSVPVLSPLALLSFQTCSRKEKAALAALSICRVPCPFPRDRLPVAATTCPFPRTAAGTSACSIPARAQGPRPCVHSAPSGQLGGMHQSFIHSSIRCPWTSCVPGPSPGTACSNMSQTPACLPLISPEAPHPFPVRH